MPLAWFGCGQPEAPVLSDLRYLGQSEDNASVLLFQVDFQDSDGDLGQGATEYFLDGQATLVEAVDNRTLFLANEMDLSAKEGTLDFVLELRVEVDKPSSAEQEFEFAVQMRDAAGFESNRENLRLQLTLHAP